MNETEWKPPQVIKIDREIAGYEREKEQHQKMAAEYEAKIDDLQERRRQWTEKGAG